ncbi:MAG: type VII toxin-antitoxin system HepT family RNase toxin [Syntrophales bacterium]
MVRKDLVAARLEKLRNYLKTLKAVRKFDLTTFKKDVFIHATAERYLHLSIECLLDVGNHIIADRGYRKPDTYAEIFEVLAEEGLISTQLLKELEGMAAFRNILVHDYFRLDLDQVYEIIQDRLKSLEKVAKIYAALME